MAEPILRVGGAAVLGEFCEVKGPVVRLLFCLQGPHGTPMQLDRRSWPPLIAGMLDELVELSMGSDYAIGNGTGGVCGASVTHLMLDPLRWDGASAMAHVARVNVPDVFARGHQRALSVALICPVLHVSLALSRWMADYCQRIARRLVHGAYLSYEEDVRRCQKAISLLLEAPDKETLLSPHTCQFLQQELQIINHLHERSQLLELSAPPSQESDVTVPLAEAVELAENLINGRGTVPLRPLDVVCGPCYTVALEEMKSLLHYYSLDVPTLLEGALGTLPSAFQVLHSPFPELAQDETKGHALDAPQFFNVGELRVLDPLRSDVNFSLNDCLPSWSHFTALYDPYLYSTLRNYGAQHVVGLAYNALRCKPIIVCGYDENSVVDAMKVACLFVPGLLQGREHALRLGIIPFTSSQLLSAEDIHRFAVVGCHVNAALLYGAPRFAQACTWHVGRHETTRGGCTMKLYGEQYDSSRTIGHYPSLSVLAPSLTADADAARTPLTTWLSSLLQSLAEPEERAGGLLWELADVLRQKVVNTAQEAALSDHVRLLLKRLLFDYCSHASLLLQHLRSRRRFQPSATAPASPPPRFSVLRSSFIGGDSDALPWVWSDVDTDMTLRTFFGVSLAARGDVIIVTELLKRMAIVVAWSFLPRPEGNRREEA
ncbi:hypothetical protein TraAM80_07451 [Trypanosoma rangeli]|uniref:Uncharacterized protein n=1 Tax=Trypanosoma rangeli TaxID=5698 RepID=A0A422N5J4_TRYRA|nr:uncharacterized protein TraAM80_07451 [Trypanosoma rangeli]RNF00726.1 hypothetical protein TraAM80_07451 [Trypanosoma rangeli]|eukprot:RNF00726.1 hypothetical protein TraAM80_07451 [Trypanosoma rangeli]